MAYCTFLDFAYYGSCEELLKSSVNNIVLKFPAELYITNDKLGYYDPTKTYVYEGETYSGDTREIGSLLSSDITKANAYIEGTIGSGSTLPTSVLSSVGAHSLVQISNPYDINITKKHINYPENEEINELRYFCASANKYDILNSDNTMVACACDWDVLYKRNGCENGQLTSVILINKSFQPTGAPTNKFYIFEYYIDGQYYLMCADCYATYKMRPTTKLIDKFFDGLDDFEKLLLNRDSVPLFTCTIDSPRETEYGPRTHKQSYTWPTNYGWNLDIVTSEYNKYMNKLIDIAQFYDEGYSNNLWNMMTHESIKNMDLTYTRPNIDEDIEDYRMGISKVGGLIMSYGRQFDEIKRTIDNIRSATVVTYDQYNNTPDYFLSDSLENSGWEVCSSVNGLETGASFYSLNKGADGKAKKCGVFDADVEFMRNLKINSKSIFSRKGTRAGMEAMLGLFGMKSYDFAKKEYELMSDTGKAKFAGKYFQYSGTTTQSSSINFTTPVYLFPINTPSANTTYTVLKKVSGGTYVKIASTTGEGLELGSGEYKISGITDTIIYKYGKADYTNFDEYSADTKYSFYDMFDYKLDEYVATVTSSNMSGYTKDGLLDVEKYNALKESYNSDNEDTLQGLPCVMVNYNLDSATTVNYVIPWFDKLAEYDGNPYFQMYGGWGKMYKKEIEQTILTSNKAVYCTTSAITTMTDKEQSFTDDFANGKFNVSVSVGDNYNYNIVENDPEGWKYITIPNLNSGDTLVIDTVVYDQTIAQDSLKTYLLAVDTNNRVSYLSYTDGSTWRKDVSDYDYVGNHISYSATSDDTTVLFMMNGFEDAYVTRNYSYEKYIPPVTIYDESFKYLGIVRDLDALADITLDRMNNGDVFYVYDISGYEEKFGKKPDLSVSPYFIINNVNMSNVYGDDGWENIPYYDINSGERNGMKVLYLESIIDDNKGNAPHLGLGKYDDGNEFKEYFNHLFKYTLENEAFTESAYDCNTGNPQLEIEDIGFTLATQRDNMKCWYFTDTMNGEKPYKMVSSDSGLTYTHVDDTPVRVGKIVDYKTTYDTDLTPYQFEYGLPTYDEAAANSIINLKNLHILFNGKYALNSRFRKFLMTSVMPYLKQLIPSTTIFSVNILGEEGEIGTHEQIQVAGITEDSYVLTQRYNKNS